MLFMTWNTSFQPLLACKVSFERLRNLWDNIKCSNIQIIGFQKEKRKSKKLKTYLKKIMKENFPSLAKEIDFQEVQEAQRVLKKVDPRKHAPTCLLYTSDAADDRT